MNAKSCVVLIVTLAIRELVVYSTIVNVRSYIHSTHTLLGLRSAQFHSNTASLQNVQVYPYAFS